MINELLERPGQSARTYDPVLHTCKLSFTRLAHERMRELNGASADLSALPECCDEVEKASRQLSAAPSDAAALNKLDSAFRRLEDCLENWAINFEELQGRGILEVSQTLDMVSALYEAGGLLEQFKKDLSIVNGSGSFSDYKKIAKRADDFTLHYIEQFRAWPRLWAEIRSHSHLEFAA